MHSVCASVHMCTSVFVCVSPVFFLLTQLSVLGVYYRYSYKKMVAKETGYLKKYYKL